MVDTGFRVTPIGGSSARRIEDVLEPRDSEDRQLLVAFDRETDRHVYLRLEIVAGGGIRLSQGSECNEADLQDIRHLEGCDVIRRYGMGRFTLLVTKARERMLALHQLIRRPHPFFPKVDLQLVVIGKQFGYAYCHPLHGWEYQRAVTACEWVSFEEFDHEHGRFAKGEAVPIEGCSLVILAEETVNIEVGYSHESASYALTPSELHEARALHVDAVAYIRTNNHAPVV